MPKTLFLSIFCFVLLSDAAHYDFFQTVQQWPPATCSGVNTTCRSPPPSMFTIHGLWPSNYSRARPRCRGSQFNPVQIGTLVPQLNTYWPDVIEEDNQRFWKHEWDKHGTCSEDAFNQFQYFQLTLNIRTNPNYDLLTILDTAGLRPTGSTDRPYTLIANAIQAATGKNPALRCNTNARSLKKQLHEITLCSDPNGVTPIDCNKFAGKNCPDHFVWLPLSLAADAGELKELLINQVSIPKFLFAFIPFSTVFVFRKMCYGIRRGGRKQD